MFRDHASTARGFATWHLPTLAGMLAWVLAIDERHRQRVALTRLDDRLLRDIGVTRADVAKELQAPLLGNGPV